MKIRETDDERPLAWTAILEHTTVYSSDGEEVGGVREVLGAPHEDIFHGLLVERRPPGDTVVVVADKVATITNRKIDIALTAEEVRMLPVHGADG